MLKKMLIGPYRKTGIANIVLHPVSAMGGGERNRRAATTTGFCNDAETRTYYKANVSANAFVRASSVLDAVF